MSVARFAKAFGSALGSRLSIAAMNYGLFWWLARQLDADRLGGFSLVMSVFFLVALLPLLGLSIPIIRRIASNSEDLTGEVTNAFGFAAPISLLVAFVISLWGASAFGAELAVPFFLIAASLLPTSWIIVAETCLVGRERLVDVARVNLSESAMRTVTAIYAVHAGYGLDGVFASFLLFRVVAALFYLRFAGLPVPKWSHWSAASQRRNWSEVPVYCGIAIVAALASRLDVILISHGQGLAETAVYAAAGRLYEAAQMVPTVLSLVIMPALARQFAVAQEQFRVSLALVLRCCLLIGLAGALVAAAVAQPLVDLLYRSSLTGAGPVLRWLVLAAALMLTDALLSSAMLAAKAQVHDLRALAVGLAVLFVGLLLGMHLLGVQGAAIAVVFSVLVRVAMRIHWATRHFGMPPVWGEALRIILSTAVGFVALTLMANRGAVVSASVALVLFGLCYVLSGGLGRRPFTTLQAIRSDIVNLAQRRRASEP
ncbi:oligosaccharide flippase family protein [Variovorax robiniae]|uniref:Oligosaccharide flippase family protein n=1 Tax=Variovorax robiniae TaxID=1836199 RepID=A0ABU8XLM7_9BURK